MVEKIYITPGNVRGLGNIVSTKTASDFTGNYANIIQTSAGDFILSYEGLLLKFNTSLASTIKDMTAYLYCTVLLEEDNSPVEDLTVTCTFEDGTVLTETTDTDGEVTFSWTPLNLGEETVTINCSQQGDYASHTQTVDIRIGLFLSFAGIMTGLTCEDDEYYEGTFETNIEHRSQLATFIKNIYVANGGERCVTQDGLVYIASPGDLVVEYDNLDQDEDYSQVIFEGEVDSLVGAVYGMSVTDNDEIVLTKLERADIVGDGPVVESVGLVSSSSSVYMHSSVTLTATVLDEDDEPLEDVNVSFLEDGTNKGYSVTNSSGVATFTYSPSSVGVHSLTAKAGGVVSSGVSVTASKALPTFSQFSVSPTTCLVNDSVTVSGILAVTPGSPVLVYDGSSVVATLYTGSNYGFSGSVVLSSSGEHSIKAVFVEDDYYQGNETDSVTVTVSKRTATLSLSASSSSVTVEDSFTLSGTLSVGSGQSVLLYRNGHYVETLTTGTNGAFSKTVTESSAGSYSYYVLFESTSVYSRVQSSTVTVTVSSVTPSFDGITLTSDKRILSAYDSESATLTAQLLNGSSPALVAGETVTFEVRKTSDDSLVETLTGTTNSSGVATVSYLGKGTGDLYIKAFSADRIIQSETYSIQDVFVYRPTEVVITGGAGYNLITSTAISNTPNAFELEVDLKTTGANSGAEDRLFLTSSSSWTGSTQPNPSVFIGFNHKFQAGTRTSSTSATDYGTRELNTYYTFKIIRSGNSWTFKVNDYTITTKTLTLSNNNIVLGGVSWNTGALSVKNLKIKPL